MTQTQLPDMPTPEELFLKTGLYQKFKFEQNKITQVMRFTGAVDFYCLGCERESTFRVVTGQDHTKDLQQPMPPYFSLSLRCARDQRHVAIFHFRAIPREGFCKIGQFPSRADIERAKVNKYRHVLAEDDYKELNRAIGLYAHGIGVGSFVYLRRIFERLVVEAAERKAEEDPSWAMAHWRNQRMEDKLKQLAGFLPETLVRYSAIYPILSKGIHELGEEECLTYFNLLQLGIEYMLDENLARKEKSQKQKRLEDELGQIAGKVKT